MLSRRIAGSAGAFGMFLAGVRHAFGIGAPGSLLFHSQALPNQSDRITLLPRRKRHYSCRLNSAVYFRTNFNLRTLRFQGILCDGRQRSSCGDDLRVQCHLDQGTFRPGQRGQQFGFKF